MSKLYDKFLNLKNSDNEKLYLFQSGIFFIALNEDAIKLSEIFGFKITNLNDTVTKCGFPSKRLEYYSSLLTKMNINFEVIYNSIDKESSLHIVTDSSNFNDIINQLVSIDFDNLTFKEAFEILYNLSKKSKNILNGSANWYKLNFFSKKHSFLY